MNKNILAKSFTWSAVLTTLFVLALGAVLIALVVGDWIAIKTDNIPMAWAVGIFIMMGFLCTLGTGVGLWIWLKTDEERVEERNLYEAMDRLIENSSIEEEEED